MTIPLSEWSGSGATRELHETISSQKDGISALSLQRSLEIGSYQTAWAMLHRLRSVLVRHRPSPNRQPPACAQPGHTKPSGQRSHSR